MAARTYPDQLPITIADDEALSEGRAAARRHNRNVSLQDQLKIGRALNVLAQAAMREAGTNRRSGRPFNEAFSRLLAGEPDLEAVTRNTRAASLWCVENWADVQPYLERLRVENPTKFQSLGVRGLRETVERELLTRHEPDLVDMPEPREPVAPRVTDTDRLNLLLRALQHSGLHYDAETGVIVIADPRSYRGWQAVLRDMAAEVAALAEADLGPLPEGDRPNGQAHPGDPDAPF